LTAKKYRSAAPGPKFEEAAIYGNWENYALILTVLIDALGFEMLRM